LSGCFSVSQSLLVFSSISQLVELPSHRVFLHHVCLEFFMSANASIAVSKSSSSAATVVPCQVSSYSVSQRFSSCPASGLFIESSIILRLFVCFLRQLFSLSFVIVLRHCFYQLRFWILFWRLLSRLPFVVLIINHPIVWWTIVCCQKLSMPVRLVIIFILLLQSCFSDCILSSSSSVLSSSSSSNPGLYSDIPAIEYATTPLLRPLFYLAVDCLCRFSHLLS